MLNVSWANFSKSWSVARPGPLRISGGLHKCGKIQIKALTERGIVRIRFL
jgi:hypothetical protein